MFLELCLEGYCDIHSPHTVNLDTQIFIFRFFLLSFYIIFISNILVFQVLNGGVVLMVRSMFPQKCKIIISLNILWNKMIPICIALYSVKYILLVHLHAALCHLIYEYHVWQV